VSRVKGTVRLLATGLLRSRAGVAVLLALVVIGVVGVARAVSGPADAPAARPPARPLVTATATPDDGPVSPDATPRLVRDAAGGGPNAVAAAFATNWVRHTGVSPSAWHQRLRPQMTTALADELSGVDPAVVPAERITGPPTVIPLGATVAEVVIPVDSGKLRLRVVATAGRWLVDGVDWDRE
jgi:hypothetical protein